MSQDWRPVLNGTSVKATSVLDGCMAIELESGERKKITTLHCKLIMDEPYHQMVTLQHMTTQVLINKRIVEFLNKPLGELGEFYQKVCSGDLRLLKEMLRQGQSEDKEEDETQPGSDRKRKRSEGDRCKRSSGLHGIP